MPKRPPFTGIHEYPPAEGGKPEGGGKYPAYGEDPFQRIMDVNWRVGVIPPIPPIPPVVEPPWVESIYIKNEVGSLGPTTTFANAIIGEPAADRLLIVFTGSNQSTGFVPTRTLIDMTINGDPMPIIGQIENRIGPGLLTSSGTIAVGYKAVAEGSTADIGVRWSAPSPDRWIAVFAIREVDFDGFYAIEMSATYETNPSVKIDVPENGLVLACNYENGLNQVTMGWTGVTGIVDYHPTTTGFASWIAGANALGLPAELQRVVTAISTRLTTNKSMIVVSWKGLIVS